MALSGSIQTSAWSASSGSTWRVVLNWTATQDISKNTSTISWNLKSSTASSGYVIISELRVKFAGEQIYYRNTSNHTEGYNNVTLASGTKTIQHNSDGTMSFTATVEAGIYNWAINKSGSGTITLDNIPRQANITSAPNFTDEQNPTISYSNLAGSAVTSLQACITNSAGGVQYAKYRDIPKGSNSYQFVLTDEERAALRNATPNSNTMPVRFYIKSVIGGVSYYSNVQKTLTITNAAPTVTASAVDTNATTIALTGDNKKFIRYYSNVKVTMSATAKKGASITSTTGADTYNNTEISSFVVGATDSRGNTTRYTATGTLVPYVRLTCNLSNNKPDVYGNMTVKCSGNYFNGSFGATSNTLTVKYRYKLNGGSYSAWADMTVTKSDNTYSAAASITGLDYTKAYIFQCQASDVLATVNSSADTVKSVPQFHWGANDFVFEVPVTFNAGATGAGGTGGGEGGSTGNTIKGDFNITGNLRLKGDGNYGNTLYFGDSSYAYITETTDDDLTIRAADLNLSASSLNFNNRSIAYGQWTPELNSSAISSYTVRQGWYQKLGSVVTIGWHIKAVCNSGYETTPISISGLPYTPAYDASGAGICNGTYAGVNTNFQCWIASTSNTITPRMQNCNNTSAANLATPANYCFYRLDGGEITIGGTICYLTNE